MWSCQLNMHHGECDKKVRIEIYGVVWDHTEGSTVHTLVSFLTSLLQVSHKFLSFWSTPHHSSCFQSSPFSKTRAYELLWPQDHEPSWAMSLISMEWRVPTILIYPWNKFHVTVYDIMKHKLDWKSNFHLNNLDCKTFCVIIYLHLLLLALHI